MARAIRGCREIVGGPSVDPWMGKARTYQVQRRSHLAFPGTPGWTAPTFRLPGRQGAFDVELTALSKGVQHIVEKGEEGVGMSSSPTLSRL